MTTNNPTTSVATDQPLTEDWLRAAGFKWHEVERSPNKHWVLWLGGARPNGRATMLATDDLGIEVTQRSAQSRRWIVWLRGDISGRYSRFLYIREVTSVGRLTRLIEAITDLPWDSANSWYGCYHHPATAARYRQEAERLDLKFAERPLGLSADTDDAKEDRFDYDRH